MFKSKCFSAVVILAIGCGSEAAQQFSDDAVCYENQTQGCVGPGACEGAQVCGADGQWSVCNCGDEPSTGGSVPIGTGGALTGGDVSVTGGALTGGISDQSGGSDLTGGTDTGGASTCVPRTCETYVFELADELGWNPKSHTLYVPTACGFIDDGCGNFINCGGCSDGKCGEDVVVGFVGAYELNTYRGQSYPGLLRADRDNITPVYQDVDGICGGGCVQIDQIVGLTSPPPGESEEPIDTALVCGDNATVPDWCERVEPAEYEPSLNMICN